jgi:hypothetical protein
MRKIPTLAAAILVSLSPLAYAQNQPDLSALPDVIKTGKWKEIDPAAVPPQERSCALNFLNDALDETVASTRAEADLMSAFIDQKKLGPQIAGTHPPSDPPPLTFDDALKIAIAMLHGPLAQSSYATSFSGQTDPAFLTAYQHLYQTTCQRKWSELIEAKMHVRWMSQFLQTQNLVKEYQAWVPGEVQKHEQQHQAMIAQRRAAEQAQAQAQEQHVKEVEQQRQAQEQQQQQQQAAAAKQMQQALAAAQKSQSQSQPSNTAAPAPYDDGAYLYPAWGYGAVTDLGATGWHNDAAYRGTAAANTEGRVSGWHGAGGRR